MEVKFISEETIKPSSPTPSHLKSFTLSLMDKVTPMGYVSFISFYKFPPSDQHLKESLSKTLTLFYPLAGIVKEDLTIDCNDSGSLFTTTHVNCSLASFLGEPRPKIDLLYKLNPEMPQLGLQPERANQIVIQLNKFNCGGVAICVCFFHKTMDGTTIGEFFRCWGCICSGNKKESKPDFSAAQLFPHDQNDILPKAGLEMVFQKSCQREGNGTTMRFVFEAGAISTLQEKARSQYVPNPTRVEVVSAFIWKHCMLASTSVYGSQHPSSLTQAIDLRRRMIPPLPKSSVGNVFWFGSSCYKGKEDRQLQSDDDFGIFVGLLRESIEKIRDEFVPKLQNGKGYEAICESLKNLKEICECQDLNPYMVSSWCKIGFNEVDFGCGKPIWVSQIGNRAVELPYKNNVILVDGGDGKIEAWVRLARKEMLELERDLEFLAFATPNPPLFV